MNQYIQIFEEFKEDDISISDLSQLAELGLTDTPIELIIMEQVSNKLKESGYTPTMIGTMDDVYYFFINFDRKVGLSVSTSKYDAAGNNKFIPNNTVLVTTVGPGSSIVKKKIPFSTLY